MTWDIGKLNSILSSYGVSQLYDTGERNDTTQHVYVFLQFIDETTYNVSQRFVGCNGGMMANGILVSILSNSWFLSAKVSQSCNGTVTFAYHYY